MRWTARIGRSLIVLAALMAVACTPAAPASPTAAPAKPTAAPAKPTAAPAAAAQPAEWAQILEAARREGVVAVAGPDGDAMREVLTKPFEEKYGIRVEFFGDAGPGIPPKVLAERSAGQYQWDIFVGGTTTALAGLLPANALDPVEPALVLPEVKDGKNWRAGGPEFLDEGKRVLVMTPFQRGTIFVNTSQVKPEEFKSYRDLLDPKWKGKMVLDDPRKAGPGQATFTFFYLHPELGPSYIRELAKQEITIIKNFQQEVDMVGQGRFPILLGSADFIVEARMRQGVPIAIVDPRQLKEGSDVSPANGAMALFNRAPHPNAARVYINWLLSKEGLDQFARVNGYVSSRTDASNEHALPWRVPQPNAIRTYDLRAIGLKDTIVGLLEEVFGKS